MEDLGACEFGGWGTVRLTTEGKGCPREKQLQVTGPKSRGDRCEVSLPIANS